MAEPEIRAYLSHLAIQKRVASSTQNVALAALLFLYKDVLKLSLERIGEVERARLPARMPVVFTKQEAAAILENLSGSSKLAAALMYGTGLRLKECSDLSPNDAAGVALIHELLHIADRIPSDITSKYQSFLNTMLVKFFCIHVPNTPLSTTTIEPPPLLLPRGGGGGGGGFVVGGGGIPFWLREAWNLADWVNSIGSVRITITDTDGEPLPEGPDPGPN